VKSQNFHAKFLGYKCRGSPNREEMAWVAKWEEGLPLSLGVTFGSRPAVGGSGFVVT